ncbi:MAG: hypothetical protein DWQ08_14350 [Proteobacteria bacterium]|nr:MAG: hypothetical protein DWQ08_14350 [Pseudomonadota bacterium]
MDDDERAASQFRTAAVSLYQSIAGPLGRASLLLEEFRDKYDLEEFCVDSPEHLPVLSNSEALRFFQNWQGITRIAQSEKEYRDMKRASKSRKGKPGPKPGSKRKG